MPIDASIYNLSRPLQTASPLEQLSGVLQVQQQMRQAQQQDQALRDQEAFRQVLSKHGGDVDEAMPDLMKVAPTKALDLQKQLMASREQIVKTHQTELDNRQKTLEMGTQVLNSVGDQATYDNARKMIGALSPDVANLMPPQYDPQTVDRLKAIGTSIKDFNTKQHEATDDYLKFLTFEGDAPKRMELATKALGSYLSTAQTPEQWASTLQNAAALGVPKDVLAMFPQEFSPEAVRKAGEMAIPPEQRQQLDLRAQELSRQTAANTETARHNRTEEGISAGRLAVARQRVALDGQAGAPPPEIKPGTLDYRMAQDIAYGKLTMADFVRLYGRAQKNAALKTAIYDQARQLNPNFNPAAFEMGYKLASNPKVQQQLASMDNVVRAVPDLLAISDKAARSGIPLVNGIIEKGGIQLGGKTYSNFHTAQIAFADELSGALGYGSATDMSRDMGFQMTDPKLSPAQFRDAVQSVVVPFIHRKRQTLLDQMGVYGQPGMNPGASGSGSDSVTPSTKVNPFRVRK